MQFWRAYLVSGKILNLLWQKMFANGWIFTVVNGQNWKHNLVIWSHWISDNLSECRTSHACLCRGVHATPTINLKLFFPERSTKVVRNMKVELQKTVWQDVRIKSSPFSPKRCSSTGLVKNEVFYKVTKYLGYFYMKICHQEI